MRTKRTLVSGTIALVTLLVLGGVALAANRGTPAPATRHAQTAVIRTSDTDNVQEGDQTTPDGPSQRPEAAGATTTSTAASTTGTGGSGGTEGSGENENSGESDGPGGHQDPKGQDVNHEFDGEE